MVDGGNDLSHSLLTNWYIQCIDMNIEHKWTWHTHVHSYTKVLLSILRGFVKERKKLVSNFIHKFTNNMDKVFCVDIFAVVFALFRLFISLGVLMVRLLLLFEDLSIYVHTQKTREKKNKRSKHTQKILTENVWKCVCCDSNSSRGKWRWWWWWWRRKNLNKK